MHFSVTSITIHIRQTCQGIRSAQPGSIIDFGKSRLLLRTWEFVMILIRHTTAGAHSSYMTVFSIYLSSKQMRRILFLLILFSFFSWIVWPVNLLFKIQCNSSILCHSCLVTVNKMCALYGKTFQTYCILIECSFKHMCC